MPSATHTATHRPASGQERPVPASIPPSVRLVVTIDGPAGTGKSSVARALAHTLGLDFLDTGAMYRAAAAIAIDRNIDLRDHDSIVGVVAEADLHFDWTADPPTILAWLEPIDARIRDEDVTGIVSEIAAIAPLRTHMVRKQRIIAEQHPRLVTEGRDQGSVAFPDAAKKFYLDASPEIRARRRAEQLRAAGREADEAALIESIKRRDSLDGGRADGPLVCPDDAERIDTSNLSFDEVVAALRASVIERVAALG